MFVDFGLYGGIFREDDVVFEEILVFVDDGVILFKMYIVYEFGVLNGFFKWVFDCFVEYDVVGVVYSEDDLVCWVFIVEFWVVGEDVFEMYL